MDATISTNRSELSKYAPRTTSLQIKVDKIRNVIGKGGVTIRELTEKYGVEIDISDDGIVKISSSDQSKSDQAIEEIKQITCEIQTGQCYAGNVSRILDFGAVITFKNGETGFLHISEISNDHVNDIKEYLSEKQELNVKVIGLDNKGRLKVSTRQLSDSAN